eukprot:CAMPEP_0114500442 /NCGR_PEP_ID=MMETSP0109-20121206/7964_1 /TAXON_ID=29199 /ORGANISM="Chlorarachnion reptans, Strain CCCM449" /LENGTH=379 /DNA_ID=CAMNT_0001678099 /DNA_START=310 /DNA_END=1450 /DNA_ORIENTATION=+
MDSLPQESEESRAPASRGANALCSDPGDVLESVCNVTVVTLADVVYGACCIDDCRARALGCDYLVHYGHSCLIPVSQSSLPVIYVFVSIRFDVEGLIKAITGYEFQSTRGEEDDPEKNEIRIALMGTIQFVKGISEAASHLNSLQKIDVGAAHRERRKFKRYSIQVPQTLPLSPGEVLGCTSPHIDSNSKNDTGPSVDAIVFVSDGTFHLEAAMLHNLHVRQFLRYDPYTKVLSPSNYPARKIVQSRREMIEKARESRRWGIIHGVLGRQGNSGIVDRLECLFRKSGVNYLKLPAPEITPRIFDAFPQIQSWVQVACPRLAIDWGKEYTSKPLLTPYEAFKALDGVSNNGESKENREEIYPMDYYASASGKPWTNIPAT